MYARNNKIDEFMKKLESCNDLLTKQQRRTLIGQATKGSVEAAEKGLSKLLKRISIAVN